MEVRSLSIQTGSRHYYWFLSGVLVFYLFVAYQSKGFHHPDEHFQIIEFANYKLGTIKASGLAWEFNARIRPGLQPALCYLLFKWCHLSGITDVYQLAFVLRALTAIVAVWVIHRFIRSTVSFVDRKYHSVYILLSFLLWFLPYIDVRFSSETWSGLLFMPGLAMLLDKRKLSNKRSPVIGLFFGFSILFRYQSALLMVGALLWLLLICRIRFSKVLAIGLSCFFVLILGFFIDYWLYGSYTVTMYNYFYVNVIEGMASRYGTAPWYKMIGYIVDGPGPVGIFIFLSFAGLLMLKPRHLLVWALMPFLLAHVLVPHKELRFLFPVAGFTPFMLVLTWQEVAARFHPAVYKWVCFMLWSVFLVTNMAGLIVIASKGAGNARVALTAYIHKQYDPQDNKVNVLYIRDHNPYYDWIHPKNTFYNSSEVVLTSITTVWQDDLLSKIKKGYTNLLVLSNQDITGTKTLALLKKLHFTRVFQTIPIMDEWIIRFYDQSINDHNLILYEYKR